MSIRNTYIGGIDWIDGESGKAIDLNDTFNIFYNQVNNLKNNLTLPIGSLISWAKGFPGVPQVLPDGWVECDGIEKDISFDSPYADINGKFTPPNLNQDIFLRGASTSGNLNTSGSHYHTLSGGWADNGFGGYSYLAGNNGNTSTDEIQPPYYSIVWIMRVSDLGIGSVDLGLGSMYYD